MVHKFHDSDGIYPITLHPSRLISIEMWATREAEKRRRSDISQRAAEQTTEIRI